MCAQWAPIAMHSDSHGNASWDPSALAPLQHSAADGQAGDKRHAPLCTNPTGKEPAERAAADECSFGTPTQLHYTTPDFIDAFSTSISAGTRAAASKLLHYGHSLEPREGVNHHHSNNHSAFLSGKDKSACQEEFRFRLLLSCLAQQTDIARY